MPRKTRRQLASKFEEYDRVQADRQLRRLQREMRALRRQQRRTVNESNEVDPEVDVRRQRRV